MELGVFEDIFKELLKKEKQKFLAFFKKEGLKYLEDLFETDFGIRGRVGQGKQPRECRPFIGWYEEDTLYFCLLTRKKTEIKLDITVCKKTKENCKWIEDTAYAFRDRKRGVVVYSAKEPIIESEFDICGSCDDLEEIEKLKVVSL